MRYAIFAMDHDNSLELRKELRQAHIDYLKGHTIQVETAGPLVAENGETPIGSLIIIDAENRAAAVFYSDDDPYTKAGLFKDVRIEAFKKTIG
jgi:uncharacterized protein YciI